jgi:hypothetical protein
MQVLRQRMKQGDSHASGSMDKAGIKLRVKEQEDGEAVTATRAASVVTLANVLF